jgi:hypothetical protein
VGTARVFDFSPSLSVLPEDEGAEFPESELVLKARLRGDLGDARGRAGSLDGVDERGFDDFADLRESLTFGRSGVAKGVAWFSPVVWTKTEGGFVVGVNV